MNSHELAVKNKEFVQRFQRGLRLNRTPEYILEQRAEGQREIKHHETKGRGVGPSERARVAAKVQFSTDLKMRTTDAQLRAYAFTVADRLIARRRRTKQARGVSA